MARIKSKNVYERIDEKKAEIKETEATLKRLNEELQVLINERDNLEMKSLYDQMRSNGIDFSKAMELLNKK